MKAFQIDELEQWCDQSGSHLRADTSGYLRYANSKALGIRVVAPPAAREAAALVSSLLCPDDCDGFYGAMMWFTNWDIGTPNIERSGLRIVERMRQGYGVSASLENAPAQLFRSDEIVDAQAFFTIPVLFGWDAYFAPHSGNHFFYVRQNSDVFVVVREDAALEKWRTLLAGYGPTLELPSYLKSFAIE